MAASFCGYSNAECKFKVQGWHNDIKVEQLPNKEIYFKRSSPIDPKFGLSSAEFSDEFITFIFGSIATLEEYETNKEKVTELKVYESGGAGTKTLNALFLPIVLLTDPGRVADVMFGCSEELSSSEQLNLSNEKPTGKTEIVYNYLPEAKNIDLRVEASGLAFEIPVTLSDTKMNTVIRSSLKYDDPKFIDFIKANQKSELMNVSITCLSGCEDYSNLDNPSLNFKKNLVIKVNLSTLYKGYINHLSSLRSEAAAEKRRHIDEENRKLIAKHRAEEDRIKAQEDKQKAIEKANQAKAAAVAKTQAAEEKNLDQFKEKCLSLGFKAGTDAFGKCVLQLIK